MPFTISCGGSFRAHDATEADLEHAFADDHARGEFIILEASDGGFMQAAGEDDGPYVLEYRDAETNEQFRASGEFSKSQILPAFVSYRRGDGAWKSMFAWTALGGMAPPADGAKHGCLPVMLLLIIAVGAVCRLWV